VIHAERPVGDSPLLDFDESRRALIEPSEQVRPRDVPAACVVTFFGDAVGRLIDSGSASVITENRWEDGPHPLVELEHQGQRVGILQSGVGAPLAAGLLEEVIALGCRAFIVCGGAGALRPEITRGHLVVVQAALRDEGTSHHYLPPARFVEPDPTATAVLTSTLVQHEVPHVVGRTWTTDAPYRETPAKIAARRAEGCVTVEMEAAALFAVAAFRGVPLAQVVYGGDDLSGETWDHRSWQDQTEVRDNLLRLAATAALELERRLAAGTSRSV
jgi:uridine phosphorylase